MKNLNNKHKGSLMKELLDKRSSTPLSNKNPGVIELGEKVMQALSSSTEQY